MICYFKVLLEHSEEHLMMLLVWCRRNFSTTQRYLSIWQIRFSLENKMAETKELKSIADRVTIDGSSGYKAEKGRYHLYISNVCPFAHRAMFARAVKGLQDVISVDNLGLDDPDKGWWFVPQKDGYDADRVNGEESLRKIYEKSHPEYKGPISVPVLFDKKTNKIVNNESHDILRMLSTEFNEFSATVEQKEMNFYPEEKRKEIDELVDELNKNVVYGVYKAISVKSQEEYEENVNRLFESLDKMDSILSTKRFLLGSHITEADIKLFAVLIRFDNVFHSMLKCNKKMISQYKNLWPYLRDLYQMSGVEDTVSMKQIKEIYWTTPRYAKATFWVPVGPQLDFNEKPDRT